MARGAQWVVHPLYEAQRSVKTDAALIRLSPSLLPAHVTRMPREGGDAAVPAGLTWLCLGFPGLNDLDELHSTQGLSMSDVSWDVRSQLGGHGDANFTRRVATAPLDVGSNVLIALGAECPAGASGGAMVLEDRAYGILSKLGGYEGALTRGQREYVQLPEAPGFVKYWWQRLFGGSQYGVYGRRASYTSARRANDSMLLRRLLSEFDQQ